MDGDQTKDTLDALADLFLTGTIPGGSRPVRVPPTKQPNDEDDGTETDADPSANESIADQLSGPDSIPLHNKPTSRPQAAVHVDEEPAVSLRLRRDEESDGQADEDDTQTLPDARVEAVFVGNLPGWSGPWLVQYAHHMATQRGPVAVLHVDDDHIEIELVTADRTDLDAIDQTVRREEIDPSNLFNLLDVMTFNLDAPVATWLVHLPAPSEPRQKSRAAQLYRWSVLTGADDTAIAAGHRLLSQLLTPSNNADQPAMTHCVGAMVMGSDEARSLEAVARFNSASADMLHQPIELIGNRAAMMPVHVKQYGPFIGDTLWPRVAEYLEELDPSQCEVIETTTSFDSTQLDESDEWNERDEQGEQIDSDREPLGGESLDPNASAKVSAEELHALGVTGDTDEDVDVDEDESFASAEQSSPSIAKPSMQSETEPASVDDAEPEREPAVFDQAEAVATQEREPAKPAALQMTPTHANHSADLPEAAEPDLAAMLATAMGGGIALDAKCPRQPDKQIMLDDQGQLHLLRQRIDSDVRGSIVDLVEASDWVREHIELLALTQRQNKFDVNAEPMLHLFADDAKAAVAAVSKLGPSVKLHLVQRVNVGNQSAWVCTDLN